jgi:hypothetical protein
MSILNKEKEIVKTTEEILEEISFEDLCKLRNMVNKEYYKRMMWED